MKIPPRHVPCEQAKRELQTFLTDWRQRNRLTRMEYLKLVVEELNEVLGLHVLQERREAKARGEGG